MKKIVFALLLFSFALGFAQDDGERYSEVLEEQIEALQLTGERKEAFIEISDKYFEKMKTIRESKASRMSKFKELKSLQSDKNAEMEQLLSESELKTFKELQKENRAMLKEAYGQKKKS